MMLQFKSNGITPMERNIMRGLYQKRLRDFTELEKERIWSRPLVERLRMDNVFDTRNDESNITIQREDPEENWPQESP